MSGANLGDRERTFALSKRAGELMRDYGSSAAPRAYTVWYTYVSGSHPLMNDAIKRLTTKNGTLSDPEIDQLYETYIDGRRLSMQAEKMNSSLIAEVEGIMEMIEVSLGATAQYGQSLQAFSQDLTGTALTRQHLRDIVSTLITNTRDVSANNKTLEARMRESRNEIEVLREALEATRLESLTDSLTGLSNRKHFEDALRSQIDERAKRAPASLIVIDVDFFKRFNDTYGHLTGDQVLRLVAIVMREHVGKCASLCRFGGEEFAILLPGTNRDAAFEVAEGIRKSVMGRELIKRSTGESLGQVTISIGVAEQRLSDDTVSFLERADACLFSAKRAGRNRTVHDDAQHCDLSNVA